MQLQTNPQLQLAADFVHYTNENIFLTGKAGTGKTTFLKQLKKLSPKRMVVVAPTGVAAINAGGVTIHSFFQISFGPQVPHEPGKERAVAVDDERSVAAGIKRFNREKINIIRSIDLLVIDEISMVRADLLDAIDEVLCRFRDRRKPFGGLQLLMIGDLQQLSPIVKDEEWNILKNYYDTAYFFSSRALKQSGFVPIELREIFRQKDEEFISLLNKIRENQLDSVTLDQLNKRYLPNFQPNDSEGYITLTTHNYQSQQINAEKLQNLRSPKAVFSASLEGDFPEYLYPTDPKLELKTGAQVMFVKNDTAAEKRYFNGKIGKIVSMDDESIEVKCPDDQYSITVTPVEWQNIRFKLNEQSQEIDEEVIGKFIQFPLKLAWAITIHKSQGLTFEKAIIDARQSFAHGQVYVALSRCKTLSGMVLRTPIEVYSVKNDHTVLGFSKEVESNQPGEAQLMAARKTYQLHLMTDLFDFRYLQSQMKYCLRQLVEQQQTISGNLRELIAGMSDAVQSNLITVSEKFNAQLQQIAANTNQPETDPVFQERIQKAAVYYRSKLQLFVEEPLAKSSFDTDNKATRKLIADVLDKIERELAMKKACLNAVTDGFELRKYLEAKAKASIEMPKQSTSTKHFKTDETLLKYPVFYHELRRWRDEKSFKENIPVIRVFSQKTLLLIANNLPSTLAELKNTKGFGQVKLQKFGNEILNMCINFRKMEGLELPLNPSKVIEHAKLSTYDLTLSMFNDGKSIAEIARDRQMARSTIETHLARFVASGELKVEQIVEPDRMAAIQKLYANNPPQTITEARQLLGEDYSYNEIRMVLLAGRED